MKYEPYNSYVVRFWMEVEGGKSGTHWRGEVESIQTGQIWQFTRLESLLRYLEEGLGNSSPYKGATQEME